MPVTDYNKKKQVEVTSQNDFGTTQDKAQPVILRGNDYTGIDGFESGSSQLGWESALKLTIDSNGEVYGDNSLQISSPDTVTSEQKDVIENISSDGKKLTGSVKIDNQTGNANDFVIVDFEENLSDVIAGLEFVGDGTIQTNTDTTSVGTWSAGTIYDFEITLDFTNSQYDVLITDESGNEQTASNISFGTGSTVKQVALFNDTRDSTQTVNAFFDRLTYTAPVEDSVNAGGYIGYDSSTITGSTPSEKAQDVAWYDGAGNLRDYEIENPSDLGDPSAEVTIWGYGSRTRDDTVQDQITYGDNSANVDRQNVTGTWNNSGQNAEMVQHLNGNATDSTSNNNDGTITGATSTTDQFDGAYNFDGTDDYIDYGDFADGLSAITVVQWYNPDSVAGGQAIFGKQDDSSGTDAFYLEHDEFDNYSPDDEPAAFLLTDSGFARVQMGTSATTGTDFQIGFTWSSSSGTLQTYFDGGAGNNASLSGSNTLSTSGTVKHGIRDTGNLSNPFDGLLGETRIYSEEKSGDWIQADYDASPKAGQVYFSQQAAETTSVNVALPESTSTGTTPNPQVAPGNVNIAAPVTQATGATPNPVVFSDLFVSIPVSQGDSQSPTPTVIAGNTSIALQESTGTGVTPNPSLFISDLIRAPPSTGLGSTPNPTIKGGVTNLAVPSSTGTGSTPNPELLFDQVVSAKVSQGIGNTPEPQVTGEAVTITMPVTTADSDTPNPVVSIEIVPRDSSTLSSIKRNQSKTLSGDINK